jgi:hypothetical protein
VSSSTGRRVVREKTFGHVVERSNATAGVEMGHDVGSARRDGAEIAPNE